MRHSEACGMNPMWYDAFSSWTSGVANLATAAGIAIGGGWVFMRFRRGRESFPRAMLAHDVCACVPCEELVLFRACVVITNTGSVRLTLGEMLVRLQQILPCEANSLAQLSSASKYQAEGLWPELAAKAVADAQCIIEPGENEVFEFDFVLPASIETVSVYTHIDNKANPGKGWNRSTWHTLKELTDEQES